MRIITLLCCFLLITSCKPESAPKKPDFLLGKWIRTNGKPGKTTYETWNTNFKGLGFSLKEKDTTFKEILSIVEINDTLFYKVVGVNPKPTLFKFTSQTDISFVAENPTHDFPTRIEYKLENDTLKARVSNSKFGIDFMFKKLE